MTGATHVISVAAPPDPRSVACVVSRCFDILSARTQHEWRRQSSLVLEPEVADVPWDSFGSCGKLIGAGVRAAEAAMPAISKWMRKPEPAAILRAAPVGAEKSIA
jgi:hypothetical protein